MCGLSWGEPVAGEERSVGCIKNLAASRAGSGVGLQVLLRDDDALIRNCIITALSRAAFLIAVEDRNEVSNVLIELSFELLVKRNSK